MQVLVVSDEGRFQEDRLGRVWTAYRLDHAFLERYLDVFDEVRIAARVIRVDDAPAGWKRVDGPRVSVHAFPDYAGVRGLVRALPAALRAASKAFTAADAVVLRGCDVLTQCVRIFLVPSCHPYGLEVTGDPQDVLAPGAIDHPLRVALRWWFCCVLRHLTASACAVGYVGEYLIHRYPPESSAYVASYPSMGLHDGALAATPRRRRPDGHPIRLAAVGNMTHSHKGHDILVKAVRCCLDAGQSITLTLVGQGEYRPKLELLVRKLSLEDRVTFAGELLGPAAVRGVLADTDLFVHPSRAEALGRAVLEAMGQGLPCIGSAVGGIPELLPPEDLVEPGNPTALSAKILEVLRDPERLDKMSARNLAKAGEYHERVLQERRRALYRRVRYCTEEYVRLGTRGLPCLDATDSPTSTRMRKWSHVEQ
jgi:glycosyltransferase involved in cell wall biosynthesis